MATQGNTRPNRWQLIASGWGGNGKRATRSGKEREREDFPLLRIIAFSTMGPSLPLPLALKAFLSLVSSRGEGEGAFSMTGIDEGMAKIVSRPAEDASSSTLFHSAK